MNWRSPSDLHQKGSTLPPESDNATEPYVLLGLRRLTTGRTVIVIAHRLSTLRNADRIYVIERGRVGDAGTYTELTSRPGIFSLMHAALSPDSTAG